MAPSPKASAVIILALFLLAPWTSPLVAQAGPPAVLSQPIVDKFARDLPVLLEELEALGRDFDAEVLEAQGDPASFGPALLAGVLGKAGADAGVREVLRRNGWDDGFWEIYYVIFAGVYVATMEQAIALYPELGPAFASTLDPFRATIHRDDQALVLRNLERLAAAFDTAGEGHEGAEDGGDD